MTEILMIKLEDGLHPTDADGYTAMRAVQENTILRVKFSVPRNVRQHRLLFALLNLVFQHQPEPRRFPTVESLLDAIKMATGHVREIRDLHGKTHLVPDSIAFGRMDQIAFKSWFDSAIHIITNHILPGVQKRDLEQQIADMLREPGPDQLER